MLRRVFLTEISPLQVFFSVEHVLKYFTPTKQCLICRPIIVSLATF